MSKQIVLVTCPDNEVAGRLAATLVEERLAACVNVVGGIRSVYRWEGKVQEDAEVLLIIKTREALFAPLEARIKALQPYEVPEIIALPITQGSAEYLDWIAQSTR